MLRKRTRSLLKDQPMSDSSERLGQQPKTNPLFSVPGLFVGLSSKALSDSDSVRSPTSPLELRVFSNLGNSFRCPRSVHDGHQKSQGCCKVGLGIIDSLDDDVKDPDKVIRSSESKNILFGPGIRIKVPSCKSKADSFEASRSLPKNFAIFPQSQMKSPLQKGSSDVVFEIGDTPLEPETGKMTPSPSNSSVGGYAVRKGGSNSGNFDIETVTSQVNSPKVISESINMDNPQLTQLNSEPVSTGSSNGLIESLPASEIELSEDYTCVISHGPNPKTTHIFCDCILEDCQANRLNNQGKKEERVNGFPQAVSCANVPAANPTNNFLSFCDICEKKLDGKDIYIYRGDKAYCSLECRSQGILKVEEKEKSAYLSEDSPKLDKGRKLFEPGLFVVS